MRFLLLLPAGATVDDLADEVTREVWTVVTAQPALARLYPGYYVAIHSVVVHHLHHAMSAVSRRADGRRCLVFEGADDMDLFKVKLAGAVVVRLDEVLRRSRALDLITREIPRAICRALLAHAGECGDAAPGRPAGLRHVPPDPPGIGLPVRPIGVARA